LYFFIVPRTSKKIEFFIIFNSFAVGENFTALILSGSIISNNRVFFVKKVFLTIPSILLGAPSDDSFLSILPGHFFLLKGNALEAIKLTISGGIFSVIISIMFLPFFIIFVSKMEGFFKILIPWILIGAIALMVFTEKDQKKMTVFVIFFSAVIGLISLQTSLIQNPLFPLITGFFGGSTILYSIQKNQKLVEQKNNRTFIKRQKVFRGTLLSVSAAAIISVIPSVGPSQAAFLLRQIIGKISRTQYLIILGGINTANFLFAFFFLFLTGKTRTGAAAAVKELVEVNEIFLFLVIFTVLISAGIGALLTELIAIKAVKKIHSLNYKLISKIIFVFLFLLSFFLSGFFGLLAFITSTAIGLVALSFGVRRTSCMAFLMIPTIFFYLHL